MMKFIFFFLFQVLAGARSTGVSFLQMMNGNHDFQEFLSLECPICAEEFTEDNLRYLTPCGHALCNSCYDRRDAFRSECPVCREPITGNEPSNDPNLLQRLEVLRQQRAEAEAASQDALSTLGNAFGMNLPRTGEEIAAAQQRQQAGIRRQEVNPKLRTIYDRVRSGGGRPAATLSGIKQVIKAADESFHKKEWRKALIQYEMVFTVAMYNNPGTQDIQWYITGRIAWCHYNIWDLRKAEIVLDFEPSPHIETQYALKTCCQFMGVIGMIEQMARMEGNPFEQMMQETIGRLDAYAADGEDHTNEIIAAWNSEAADIVQDHLPPRPDEDQLETSDFLETAKKLAHQAGFVESIDMMPNQIRAKTMYENALRLSQRSHAPTSRAKLDLDQQCYRAIGRIDRKILQQKLYEVGYLKRAAAYLKEPMTDKLISAVASAALRAHQQRQQREAQEGAFVDEE